MLRFMAVFRPHPTTVHEVLERAKSCAVSERAAQWVVCGSHDLTGLPVTSDEDNSAPLRFCANCWTVFGVTGQPLNPPTVVATPPAARATVFHPRSAVALVLLAMWMLFADSCAS